MPSCPVRPQTVPPWGIYEPRVEENCSNDRKLRPRTRSELLRTRREELQSFARDGLSVGESRNTAPWSGEVGGWWTFAEGYREYALEAFARCANS